MHELNLAKFGGSSLAAASGILNCFALSQYNRNQLVVVSANGKTTQALHDFWWHFSQGEESTAEAIYEKIQTYYTRIVCDLPLPEAEKEGFYPLLDDLFDTLNTKTPEEAFSLKVRDTVLGFGEKFSMSLFSIMSRGIYHPVPAGDFFVTDSSYGEAKPLMEETRERVGTVLKPLLEAGKWVVTEGFVGKDVSGTPTTIGFEGSDYTAALLSNFLDAENLTIWTDVAGVYTADPRLVFEPKPIKEMSYAYASQVSLHGAKVLHPRTLEPLIEKEIPLTVKSSFRSDVSGTLIAQNSSDTEAILTYFEGKALIHKATDGQLSQLKKKFDVFPVPEKGAPYKIYAIIVDEHRSLESFMEDVFATLYPQEAVE